jgi:hypothetical protein
MRTIELIWEVDTPALGRSWFDDGSGLRLFEVMPDGSRERVIVNVKQVRV